MYSYDLIVKDKKGNEFSKKSLAHDDEELQQILSLSEETISKIVSKTDAVSNVASKIQNLTSKESDKNEDFSLKGFEDLIDPNHAKMMNDPSFIPKAPANTLLEAQNIISQPTKEVVEKIFVIDGKNVKVINNELYVEDWIECPQGEYKVVKEKTNTEIKSGIIVYKRGWKKL